jgi:hypothetical protein
MHNEPDELIKLPLSLQLRPEGEFWVARLVHTGGPRLSQRDRLVIATIRVSIIKEHPRHRAAFLRLCQEIGADLIEKATGHRPEFGIEEDEE